MSDWMKDYAAKQDKEKQNQVFFTFVEWSKVFHIIFLF
jgi:hypothetical protein